MSKPTNKPGWNPTDTSKVVEPTSTKKSQGWSAGEKPAAEHFNWLMKNISDWIDHVDVDVNSRISAVESRTTGTVQANIPSITFPYGGSAAPSEFDAGRASTAVNGVKTINWANGSTQKLLLDVDCSLAYTGAVAGNTYYLRIQQNGGLGYYSITGWPQGTVWNGNTPVITKSLWAVDVIGVYFDGTNYFSFITQNYYNPPIVSVGSGNGYCGGGSATTTATYISTLNKFSFANDSVWTNVQSEWGRIPNSTNYPTPSSTTLGNGSQTATHGYQLKNGSYVLKLDLANDVGAPTYITITASNMTGLQGAAQNSVRAIGFGNQGTSTTRNAWKYLFSTDVSSNLGSYISNGGTYLTSDGAAASFPDFGIHLQDYSVNTNPYNFPIYATSNATDVFTNIVNIGNSYALRAEGLYDENNAYFLSRGNIRKFDRVTYLYSDLSMATPQYKSSAGMQNSAYGYWAGGATSSAGTTASNVICKLNFVTSGNQTMSTVLPTAKLLGAGFEG